MNKVVILILLAGICATVSIIPFVAANNARKVVFSSAIIPCGPEVNCGGFPQNVATMAPVGGEVTVRADGSVKITLKCNCPNDTFEVLFGSFTPRVFVGNSLGTIKTNSLGEFVGPITAASGSEFVFLSTGSHSGQFVFNVPGVRSEFVTGFTI